jgi:hypothetical protein
MVYVFLRGLKATGGFRFEQVVRASMLPHGLPNQPRDGDEGNFAIALVLEHDGQKSELLAEQKLVTRCVSKDGERHVMMGGYPHGVRRQVAFKLIKTIG